jgi:hypothetical protein
MPAKQKRKEDANSFEMSIVLGVIGMIMAVGALINLRTGLAIGAIICGSVSVWLGVRRQKHTTLFLGMSVILIGIMAVWSFANNEAVDLFIN